MKAEEIGERGLIQRVRRRVGPPAPGVSVGIGDDAAVLTAARGSLVVTTDLVIESVHFRRRYATPEDIGWKAMAVNLSDIAAMGGTPRFALVALACAPETPVEEIDALYAGMNAAAEPHGVQIVGGDTSASPDGWIVNVTLLGEIDRSPRLRSAAQVGDLIAVTGFLGSSAAGLKTFESPLLPPSLASEDLTEVRRVHLRPTPRVAEGLWLGGADGVHSMIDCSDGVATDLGHIASESGVGFKVWLPRLPVAQAAQRVAGALGLDPMKLAATGGEDYELLVTLSPEKFESLSRDFLAATGTPLTAIGEIVPAAEGLQFLDALERPVSLGKGFDHFRKRSTISNQR
jgi:thiamine-monophosphate kinase